MIYKAEIPYGAYWSTPFARWQGSLAHLQQARQAFIEATGLAGRPAARRRRAQS